MSSIAVIFDHRIKKSLQTRKRVRREVEFSSGRVYTAHQSTVFLFGGLCCQIFMKLFLLKQEIICPIARDFRPFHKKPRFCKIYIVRFYRHKVVSLWTKEIMIMYGKRVNRGKSVCFPFALFNTPRHHTQVSRNIPRNIGSVGSYRRNCPRRCGNIHPFLL